MKLYNTATIARFLDISERRVRQLREKGVLQEARPGLYDFIEANHAYINYLRKRNPESEENIDYNTERAKLVRAKRLNEEFDLKVKEGQLHYAEDIERALSGVLINFKTRLMAIPAKLSPALAKKKDQAEIFKLLQGQIYEALEELSDFNNIYKEDTTDNEDGDK